ncbi:hypothetical protein MTO96_042847 [Rhipicephalus appendiculatus]
MMACQLTQFKVLPSDLAVRMNPPGPGGIHRPASLVDEHHDVAMARLLGTTREESSVRFVVRENTSHHIRQRVRHHVRGSDGRSLIHGTGGQRRDLPEILLVARVPEIEADE